MKQLKILLVILAITTICSTAGVFAKTAITLSNELLPINQNQSSKLGTKKSYGDETLTVNDSYKEGAIIKTYRAIDGRLYAYNSVGDLGYTSWVSFYSKGTQNLTSSFTTNDTGKVTGLTQLLMRTSTAYSDNTIMFGEWVLDK